jgi:hypothetical protein
MGKINMIPERPTDLNELAIAVHEIHEKWWVDIKTGEPIARNAKELLALTISEVSECLEGERRNIWDDKLPTRKMAEVEMADTKIRLLDFAAGFGVMLAKMELPGPIPDNKGEALFNLIQALTMISQGPQWISLCLSYIDAYCVKFGYDLDGAMWEKLEYNKTRLDHTHEARQQSDGKRF